MKKSTELFIENCINEYMHGLISIDDVMDKAHDKVIEEIYLDVIQNIVTKEIEKRLPQSFYEEYYSNVLDDFVKNYDKYRIYNALLQIEEEL
jgi:hypothetical protein